ncbi:MAG: hypothetical protein VKL39_24165, partial [Leptolyngbyaceae bacterium]|nr:hypothetical protein [Leptolyngbyaceae bacterium]
MGRVQAFRYGSFDWLVRLDHDERMVYLLREDESVGARFTFDEAVLVVDAVHDAIMRRVDDDGRIIDSERIRDVRVVVHTADRVRDGVPYVAYQYTVGDGPAWTRTDAREWLDSMDAFLLEVEEEGGRGTVTTAAMARSALRVVGGE